MLVGAQHSSNKVNCIVCSFCFQFIGSIELQIGRKLYLEELGISADGGCGSSGGLECSSSSEKIRLSHDTIQSLMEGHLQLPYSENFPLPPVVSCIGGCKEAYYCSKSCAQDRDGQATILALRPISKDDEITISYIDENLPYEERQLLLADYGFTCKCPRCVEEAP
ncbi:hypothetical protein AAHA92_10944 [Salvia divinorum]|uniref:Histone-lysine N-methyltransferase ATXR2 n=1 Tax=Salvia divinorum TaxID=28513 RepID=A0ABD1I0E0_SALDI